MAKPTTLDVGERYYPPNGETPFKVWSRHTYPEGVQIAHEEYLDGCATITYTSWETHLLSRWD